MANRDIKHLYKIDSPADLRKLSVKELDELAVDIRQQIIGVVASNGGHLAPNLGVVELTIALHYVFDTPNDKVVWDVGHQSYVHKLLTGRREFFSSLRQTDGCSGFIVRGETPYDTFTTGHAGTAISAALGMAAARDAKHKNEKVIAVVGDGSLNCGISLEGLNHVSETTKNFIIILNDNKMSISPSVGAIHKCLTRIISGKSYNRFKAFAKMMVKKIAGDEFRKTISRIEEATKSIFFPGVFFEELGLRYIGPVDGHDIPELIRTFKSVGEINRPVLLHVITEKGRGYSHAVNAPEKFHGLPSFEPDTGQVNGGVKETTFSSAFGYTVSEIAEKYGNVAVITAGMRYGTGLMEFSQKHHDKFFDVGIAEEHALVFAAGLAAEGSCPIVAMYATFLQRALDCVFHDICLQNLPVIVCCDRAGIVDDGPTHHGIHDLSFLRNMPNLSIMSPKNESELRHMLFSAYEKECPVVIRYPRGASGKIFEKKIKPQSIEWGKAEVLQKGNHVALWGVGKEVYTALKVSEILEKHHSLKATVVNTRFLKPFDVELLLYLCDRMPIVTIEDCQTQGGLASIVDEILINVPHNGILHFGWGDSIIPHGDTEVIRQRYGFTPENITRRFIEFREKGKTGSGLMLNKMFT